MKYLFWLVFLLTAFPLTAENLRQGSRLYADQKYGQALETFNHILQENPYNQEAALGAGASAYYLKDYQTAQRIFENLAKEKGEKEQDAYFNLGNTFYRSNQMDKAIQAYKQAIIKNPKDRDAAHNLQLILQQQNQQNNKDQNQNNNDSDSSNQDNQAGGEQGQAPQQEDNSDSQKMPKQQMDNQDAQRVMQMARENEYKKPTQQGIQTQSELVEKDW